MRKIQGYILVKETGAGIHNLVVAAYDSELAILDLISENRTDKGFSPKIMKQLGKRIGSVLTDNDGKFMLSHEDLQFEGVESRPDLILIAFAPEDIQSIDKPYPIPPEDRILYISSVPRDDAGSEEAYIIRLLQKQLDQYKISSGSRESETESTRVYNSVEKAYFFRDNLKEKLAPRLKKEVERSESFKTLAKEKLKQFSAIPIKLRNHPLLVKDMEQLDEVQLKVIKDGLDRFKKYKGVLRLNLTKQDFNFLGLKEENGKIVGKADPLLLAEKVKSKMGGTDLVRVREVTPPTSSAEELLSKYSIKNDNPVGPGTDIIR